MSSSEGFGGSMGCSSASGCWADSGGIGLILGLAIIAALAIGIVFLMIRVIRRAPSSQGVAHRSVARSRTGLLLSIVIPIGAFTLQAIFGQFWLGLGWILLGGALGVSLELTSKRRIGRPPA